MTRAAWHFSPWEGGLAYGVANVAGETDRSQDRIENGMIRGFRLELRCKVREMNGLEGGGTNLPGKGAGFSGVEG